MDYKDILKKNTGVKSKVKSIQKRWTEFLNVYTRKKKSTSLKLRKYWREGMNDSVETVRRLGKREKPGLNGKKE